MRTPLTLVTAPTDEPVTLSEVKSFIRVDGSDDDAQINMLISTARASAEEYLRRPILTQSFRLTLDIPCSGLNDALGAGVYDLPITALHGSLPSVIQLPKPPIQSITSVTTYDLTGTSSTFDPSNYTLDTAGGRLVLAYGAVWPTNLRRIAAVEIVYTAGYGSFNSVPKPIRTGIMMHVASLYEQRGQCADAMDIPPGAKQLYSQYRIIGHG